MQEVRFTKAHSETPTAEELAESEVFHSLIEKSNKNAHDKSNILSDFSLFCAACAAGIKSGLTCSFDEASEKELASQFKKLGFFTKTKIDIHNEVSSTLVHASPHEEFIEPVEMRVENEAYGRFLGVPEPDLLWYEEDGAPSIDSVTPVPKHLGLSADQWPKLRFARLSPWICRPTVEGLRRTIRIGEAWYALAERLDRLGVPEPLEYARTEVGDRHHPWYRF